MFCCVSVLLSRKCTDTDFGITAFKLQAPVAHEIVNVLYLCGCVLQHT